MPGSSRAGAPSEVVLESVLDEANLNDRGWASLQGRSVIRVAPWRVIYEYDSELKNMRPVALVGIAHSELRRTWTNELVKEISESLDSPRDHKLYRARDLVTTADVARMCRVKRRTINQWMRRDLTFPRPLLGSRRPYVWDRREVWDWARRTERIKLGRHDRRVDSRSVRNPQSQ
jgi:predicted DNA-binding transcriptional regulator AlpA